MRGGKRKLDVMEADAAVAAAAAAKKRRGCGHAPCVLRLTETARNMDAPNHGMAERARARALRTTEIPKPQYTFVHVKARKGRRRRPRAFPALGKPDPIWARVSGVTVLYRFAAEGPGPPPALGFSGRRNLDNRDGCHCVLLLCVARVPQTLKNTMPSLTQTVSI